MDKDFSRCEYPILLPLPLAEKIRRGGEHSPLWLQFVPRPEESSPEGLFDPIGDHRHGVGGQLVHRYKNRALFFPTTRCPVLCRYCFRKNELARPDEMFTADLLQTVDYLKQHSEIEEIIFSGGDPFILSNQRLSRYLSVFAEIPSLKYLRFHTRTPVVLPERFEDAELFRILEESALRFDLVTLVIHLNHRDEIDAQVESALRRMKKLPLHLTSQSVLLKGVNDSVEKLKQLFVKIVSLGVTPYYLHHPDKVRGGMHFYVSRKQGRRIYEGLRRQSVGQVLPHYVVELPDGGGKVSAEI